MTLEEPIKGLLIVIINFNGKNDTADCIQSFLQTGANLNQIIVVDNASNDNSANYLRDCFGSELDIVSLRENMGFAGGSNRGIQRAIERNAEWILLMNNDTIVDSSFLKEMGSAIDTEGGKYQLFSPLIFYFEPSDLVWSVTTIIIPGTMISYNPYRGRKISQLTLPEVLPSDFIHGCSLLAHRSVYETVGMFDSRFFIYNEEVDLSWRSKRAGFKMAIVTKAHMWHKISAVMGKQKPRTRYLQTRNQIWVYRRYSKGLQIIIMFLFTIWHAARQAILDLFNGQPELLAHTWRGFKEGWSVLPAFGSQ